MHNLVQPCITLKKPCTTLYCHGQFLTTIYKLGQAFKTMYNLVQHWTTMYKLEQPNTILDINVLVQPCKTLCNHGQSYSNQDNHIVQVLQSTSVAKVKSLKLTDFEMRYGSTDAWTDARTDERMDAQTGGLLELLSQLKVEW